MRAQAAWKVITHIDRVERPSNSSTRSRISWAALLVNVMARISPARARSVWTSQAIRCVSTRVLPEPAPARTSRGPSGCVTASRCGGFNPASRSSRAAASGTAPRIRSGPEAMALCDDVREHCASVAAGARWVAIDEERLGAYDLDGPPPEPDPLDPERHFLEGSREDVAAYLLILDAINFGSGWFPLLRKRPFCSGYYTVAWALADHVRAHGVPSNARLRAMGTDEIARILEQDPAIELMSLFAQALRELGRFLGDRSPLAVIEGAKGSAEQLAQTL